MISADIKTDLKQREIKELVVGSYNFSQKYYLLKKNLEICNYILNRKRNPLLLLSVKKVICRC